MRVKNIEIDYSKLVGIPYEDVNCWELARLFYDKILEINLKQYYDTVPNDEVAREKLISSNKGDFHKVETPHFGDLVTMRIFGIECHIGIYLGDGKILHTIKGAGSIVDRADRLGRSITGYYRVKDVM